MFKSIGLINILVWCLASSINSKSKFEANTCWFKSSSTKNKSCTQEGV